MTASYDDGFRKIAQLQELKSGQPRVYRAAGSTLVLRRSDEEVEAIDGSCLSEGDDFRGADRVQRILDCVASGSDAVSTQWPDLVQRAGLPVRIEGDAVWVCLDGCKG